MMNDLTIVIPVREGSERVKNKNFKKFADSNLLQLKIEQVKKLQIGEIIVNTDSDIAIEIAKKNNVKYHRRDKYYASNECNGSEYFAHIAEVTKSKNILIAPVTSPLVKLDTFIDCINIFKSGDYDSLVTTIDMKRFLWHEDKPINYDLDKAPQSQDLPELFCPTFGVVLAKRESILKHKNWICGKSYFHKVSELEAVDIDTELDFKFAEYLYRRQAKSIDDYTAIVDGEESKNISIDFDGVVHKNSKGLHDGTVYDDPIAGAIEAIKSLSEKYNIVIFSAKAKPDRPLVNGKTGIELIWEWLEKYNLSQYISEVTSEKPRAIVYIDDKAIRFTDWNQTLNDLSVIEGNDSNE